MHRAVGHDGRRLAVKVQHARLRDSCTADILTVETVVRAAHLIFPEFNYQWLVEEMKDNLPKVKACKVVFTVCCTVEYSMCMC